MGNFGPSWSTENHIGRSLEAIGCDLVRIQEETSVWKDVPERSAGCNLVLWTRTFGLDRDLDAQTEALSRLRDRGTPTATWHLDKWWDLPREDQIGTEPFFTCDHVFTADGGNDERWRAAGVNHHWMPPGVVADECVIGAFSPMYRVDVAFVGNWNGSYHPEWKHRAELITFLRRAYAGRFRCWPRGAQVRGLELSNLYATAKVVVGDSCMVAGTGYYWSDRIPETLGRGGFLLHPDTAGLSDHYAIGEHLDTWPLGDWSALRGKIDHYLRDLPERNRIRSAGYTHVKESQTYAHKARQVLATIGLEP